MDKTCEPEPADSAYYDKGHALYQKLYARLQPLYRELGKL